MPQAAGRWGEDGGDEDRKWAGMVGAVRGEIILENLIPLNPWKITPLCSFCLPWAIHKVMKHLVAARFYIPRRKLERTEREMRPWQRWHGASLKADAELKGGSEMAFSLLLWLTYSLWCGHSSFQSCLAYFRVFALSLNGGTLQQRAHLQTTQRAQQVASKQWLGR